MAHQVSDGGDIDILILQQDGEAQTGTGPGDMLMNIRAPDPLLKHLITTVIGRQVKHLTDGLGGKGFPAPL